MDRAVLKPRPAGWLLLCLAMLGTSCARIVPLSGGDPDALPPCPVRYRPDSAARFFAEKTIKIRFDEYIQLRDPLREILISPPLKNPPQIVAKGRNLIIRLPDETLKPSATYLIQFGKAIADLNEGNVLKDFFYVFSTGSELDSGALSGSVLSVPDLIPLKGMRIMLFSDTLPDSLVLKTVPAYFADSDEAGRFSMRFLRPGFYHLAALKEENNNMLYDRPGEWLAFHPEKIQIAGNTPSVNLTAFREPPTHIDDKTIVYESPGKAVLPRLPDMRLRVMREESDSLLVFTTLNDREDSLLIFFSEPPYAKEWRFLMTHGSPEKTDTLKLTTRFGKTQNTKSGPGKSARGFAPAYTGIQQSGTSTLEPLWIRFPEPVIKVDSTRLRLLENDKDTLTLILEFSDSSRRHLLLRAALKPDKAYKLTAGKGAFVSLSAKASDSLSYIFRTLPSIGYSALQAGVSDTLYRGKPILIELLDEKLQRLKPVYKTKEGELLLLGTLPAGRYRLRLTYDRNENGRWDTGNFRSRRQPEEIILLSQIIELRPGMAQKIIWNPHEKKSKL